MSATPLGGGAKAALFLDFDGTLVELSERPETVMVDPSLASLLARVRDRLDGRLAIATGRPIASVDGFFPDLALDACGLHGLEWRVAGRLHRPDLPSLEPHLPALHARLDRFPGVLIENKTLSLAVHWRLAPEAEGACEDAMAALAAALGPDYRRQTGKMMVEVLPARADKGAGIAAMMGDALYAGRAPVFAGDDRTDEHGFTAVAQLGGAGVKVGSGPTAAPWRLAEPEAVHAWLGRIAEGADPREGLPAAV